LLKAWRANGRSSIHFKEWADEFVVYCDATATTHLIGSAAAVVLLTFVEAESPLTADHLVHRLGLADGGNSPATHEMRALDTILNELEQIELIEAVAI
jgi:hypothetical protein